VKGVALFAEEEIAVIAENVGRYSHSRRLYVRRTALLGEDFTSRSRKF